MANQVTPRVARLSMPYVDLGRSDRDIQTARALLQQPSGRRYRCVGSDATNGKVHADSVPPPLSRKAIAISAVLAFGGGVLAVVLLLLFLGGGSESDRNKLDVVRTAASIVVGTGGAAALLLAARRQRYTELALVHQYQLLDHQREVANRADSDAAERRILESYTKAAEQLGSDKAAVRLAGVYALERLAGASAPMRVTVLGLLCAYLRMPFVPPSKIPDLGPPTLSSRRSLGEVAADRAAHSSDSDQARSEELEVRLAVQDVIARHLRPRAGVSRSRDFFWTPEDSHVYVNLAGATLIQFSIRESTLGSVNFSAATFYGNTLLDYNDFSGFADFRDCTFRGLAWFNDSTFRDRVVFADVAMMWPAIFRKARFEHMAFFEDSSFSAPADFKGAYFERVVDFSRVKFADDLDFSEVVFEVPPDLSGVKVAGTARKIIPASWGSRVVDPVDSGEEDVWWTLDATPDRSDGEGAAAHE
ncbi:pentapeptide repeat-containing protein [Actinosynnema sp. NPDC004786]